MAGKQPLKRKEVPSFNVKDFKKNFLGEKVGKVADKELEWIISLDFRWAGQALSAGGQIQENPH